MSDTNTHQAASPQAKGPSEPGGDPPTTPPKPENDPSPSARSLSALRRGLLIGAVALMLLNFINVMTAGGGGSRRLVAAVLWGGVAVLSFAAFVVYWIETAGRREEEKVESEGVGGGAKAKMPDHARAVVDALVAQGSEGRGPRIEGATPVRLYRLGERRAALLEEIQPAGDVDYRSLLVVYPEGGKPELVVSSEARVSAEGGEARRGLGLFLPDGSHQRLGDDTGGAPAPFSERALAIARERLSIDEEPELIVDAALSPSVESEEKTVVRKGNPLRWVRGGVTAGVGALFAFLFMAHDFQLRWGVPLGAIFVLVAVWGVMDLLGTFDDPDDRVAHTTSLSSLGGPLLQTLITGLLFSTALGFAATGKLLPPWVWGLLVTITFVALVMAVYGVGVKLGPWATDENGEARPIWRRHGFWVVTAAAALYLPFMGDFSLWDPWETHYGEVAREILSRDDWISLWWAQDGWFWSKPILNFWMQALSMATLGVHYRPEQMLIGDGSVPTYQPEWAVRAPVVLLAILAMYILYKGVAKAFGRRAGLLGGLVLATMPDWYFLAHQTMTDMPFVSAMTAAMGLLLLGLRAPEDTNARVYEVVVGKTTWRLSAWHLVFGGILLCAIPQILYLFSRNLDLIMPGHGAAWGFRPHLDEFKSGSAGNCGLPGNEGCVPAVPASVPRSLLHPEGFFQGIARFFGGFEPTVQALLWAALLGGLLYMSWGERRVRRLYYLAAWLFAAIATMGKGPAGFGLPMICAFAYVCTTKHWKELTRFELVAGLLVILTVALPWYVAMYVRHGSPFTDRLIFHDMFNRAFSHVHDTNEGDDTSFRFYIWQLGYAFFPWTGLAPLGLIYWMRRSDSADKQRGDTSVLLVMWFLFAYALFSFMGTKFHHYIFPAVPPVAMLIGVVLDEMMGDRRLAVRGALPVYVGGIAGGLVLTLLGLARFWPGSVLGTKSDGGKLSEPSYFLGVVLVILGVALVAGFAWMFRGTDESPEPEDRLAIGERRRSHESLMLGAAALGAALVLVLVGRDLSIKPEGNSDQTGAIRLLQLFTYNYRRPWPDSLDFTAVLSAFAVVGVLLCVALAFEKIRRHVVVAFVGFAFLWGLWGLDVYMVKVAPHWGQREVIQAYYANRHGEDEPLVAYQMNWKGENFYTGNRIPAFVSTGASFTTWIKKQRESGVKTVYFVTEHGRINGVKSESGAKSITEVTTRELCNKFVLLRAEL